MPRIEERFEIASSAMAVYDALSQPYGPFVRRMALPEGLDLGHARAVLRNGVLQARIPAMRTQRSRTIPFESDATERRE